MRPEPWTTISMSCCRACRQQLIEVSRRHQRLCSNEPPHIPSRRADGIERFGWRSWLTDGTVPIPVVLRFSPVNG